jgi:hypothetical protein
MKTSPNIFLVAALLSLFLNPATALDEGGSKFTSARDSMDYTRSLSFYKEFYKIKLYKHAIGPWWDLFENYPASSEKLYIDGVKMYRNFIQSAADDAEKELYVDTLMLIYDQRMEYFGGEGNVLGRQGSDLLVYGRKDPEKVKQAYYMLEKSIELEGKKARAQVVLNYMSAGMMLNQKDLLEDNQLIGAYLTVNEIIEQNQGKSSRWDKTRASIDELMYKEDLLSCDALTGYFEPRFDQSKEDQVFLEQVISTYAYAQCEDSDMYLAAFENLYLLAPQAESAHQLAIMYTSRADYPTAIKYLEMAVQADDINNDTRAEWFYKLSIVSSASQEYCKAISAAREAIDYKDDFGKAYVALGDAIVAYRYQLKDEFEQRAAFWVAAEKYRKALKLDTSLEEEVSQKLKAYKDQYPDKEEIFFRDLKEGASYRVLGCINENATIMASN